MKGKLNYEVPEITVVIFDTDDLLTTSTSMSNGFDGEVDDNW